MTQPGGEGMQSEKRRANRKLRTMGIFGGFFLGGGGLVKKYCPCLVGKP